MRWTQIAGVGVILSVLCFQWTALLAFAVMASGVAGKQVGLLRRGRCRCAATTTTRTISPAVFSPDPISTNGGECVSVCEQWSICAASIILMVGYIGWTLISEGGISLCPSSQTTSRPPTAYLLHTAYRARRIPICSARL